MESERCGTQEHVSEKGRVRLDYRQVNISDQILEISLSRSIEETCVKKSHFSTIECDFASFLQTERLQSSWYERCIS